MTIPLDDSYANVEISYNGYTFNTKTKSEMSARPNVDASGRVISTTTFTIVVSSWITPRVPVPGTDGLAGLNGISNTVDSEMLVIKNKLSQNGKTFKYIGQGTNDLYVNTTDPNLGNFIPDVNFGPFVKIISFRPVGLANCWFVRWQIECTIHMCPLNIDYNNIGKRIQEYVFTVDYSYDFKGYCKRTVSGHLKLISPVNFSFVPVASPDNSKPYTGNPYGVGLTFDNSGNLSLYETADQYRDIIYNSILIPFSFIRIQQSYRLSADKRMIMFTITDEEQPAFSIVPGYAKVSFTQSSNSTTYNLQAWSTTLTGKFTFPKFIKGTNSTKIVSTVPGTTGYSNQVATLGEAALGKIYPRKNIAFADFMRVVYQRFGLAIALQGVTVKGTYAGGIPLDKINVGAIVPKNLSIEEDITGDSITFSISFFVTTNKGTENVFVNMGVGLPIIIAADLNASASTAFITAFLASGKITDPAVKNALQYALTAQLAQYTDISVHDRWLITQKYACNSSRGSSNLIFSPSFDAMVQICGNNNNVLQVVPLHGIRSSNPTVRIAPIDMTISSISPVAAEADAALAAKIKALALKGGGGIKDEGLITTALGWTWAAIMRDFKLWSNIDLDLFQAENLGISGQYNDENGPLYGPFSYNSITNNINGGLVIDPTTPPAFLDCLETFSVSNLIDIIGIPSPEKSFIEYECSISTYVNNQLIRHKPLAQQDFSPQTVTGGNMNILENNFYTIYNCLHDNLVGEAVDSTYYLANPPLPDNLQIVGAPSTVLVIKGYALRAGYDVNPPNMIVYGGQQVFQKSRYVDRKQLGSGAVPFFYAEWFIEYYVAGLPLGVCGVPDHPTLREEGSSVGSVSADVLAIYELQQLVPSAFN